MMPRKNLIYFLLFSNPQKGQWHPDDYLDQLRLCLQSLKRTSDLSSFDVVFLADEDKARGIRTLPEIAGFSYEICTFEVPAQLTSAMCTRFRIHDLMGAALDRYQTILYADIDIVFLRDVRHLFEQVKDPDVLYVKPDHWCGTRADNAWFSLGMHPEDEARRFVEQRVEAFNSGQFAFVNSPAMAALFAELSAAAPLLAPKSKMGFDQPIMNSFLRSRHLKGRCLEQKTMDSLVHLETDEEAPRTEKTVLVHFIKSNKLIRMKEELGLHPKAHEKPAMVKDDMPAKTAFAKAQEHHKNNRLADAEGFYRSGLLKEPQNAGMRSYLGYLLYQMKRDAEALAMLDQAIAVDPRMADAYAWRGLVLTRLGRVEEAVAANQMAVKCNPKHAGAHNNLGLLLTELRRHGDAIPHLRRAIELGYRRPEPFVLVGRACVRIGKLGEAEQAFREALKLDPKFVDARIGLGNVLYDLGEQDAALAELGIAIKANPKALGARSNYVMKLLYHGGVEPERVVVEHKAAGRAYFEQFGSGGPIFRTRHMDPERKLRIGYISPDFHQHATAFFLDPLLSSHDPDAVEVHCYSNADITDAMTEHLKGLVFAWHDISKLPYREAAAQIAADEIDILIDCAGHTNRNRLDVLSLKPAPIQYTWLGYPHGTGLPTVDFRLTDEIADPPGMTESHYVEQLSRLPEGTFCYRAPADVPLPAPGPLLRGEGPVFGCFNNPHKIGPEVIRLWAAIVNAVPGARLRLKARQFLDEGAAARYRKRFVAAGLSADRIEIEGRRTFKEGFAEYASIDVALDPFPYHGTTSTCEALWMATPVVVLAGKTCVSRVGVSLLSRVGLEDLVARDEAHYQEIAVGLIQNKSRLAELRRTLRDRMANSALCDGPRFAKQMEAEFRRSWRLYCAQNAPATAVTETAGAVVEIDLG